MTPPVFQHLGPKACAVEVATCCRLTERIWEIYLGLAGQYQHQDRKSREYLDVRMLYIAETTSTAVRLNASWGLIHPAMSLLRDRYEQVVRFSYLARNPDADTYQKYERAMMSKMSALVRKVSQETRDRFEKQLGPLPAWALEAPSKEQKAFFEEWNALDLRSMVTKRDGFPPIADIHLAREKLAQWYDAIYSQFSSVSHYDRYSIELLTLNKWPDGRIVLGAQPHWPSILILQNAQLDLIQCFEAAQICHKSDAAAQFEALHIEWLQVANEIAAKASGILRQEAASSS